MIRVAYCSEAVQPDLALLTLAEIVSVSDRNNRRDRVTGALLVSAGRFFQVLEGAAADVDRTLARIAADPRHHRVKQVMRRDVPGRLFARWHMIAARVAPHEQATIDKAIDECHQNPVKAIDTVLTLVERQAHQP
ncbi:MAG: BLUF domain-containing protein [Brevundimonas sp.]